MLKSLGYDVALLGRSVDAVDAAAQKIQKEVEKEAAIVRGYKCDVRDFDEVKETGEQCFGFLHLCVIFIIMHLHFRPGV